MTCLVLFRDSSMIEPYARRMSRRGFMTIGSLGLGGLTLPQVLRADRPRERERRKSRWS